MIVRGYAHPRRRCARAHRKEGIRFWRDIIRRIERLQPRHRFAPVRQDQSLALGTPTQHLRRTPAQLLHENRLHALNINLMLKKDPQENGHRKVETSHGGMSPADLPSRALGHRAARLLSPFDFFPDLHSTGRASAIRPPTSRTSTISALPLSPS